MVILMMQRSQCHARTPGYPSTQAPPDGVGKTQDDDDEYYDGDVGDVKTSRYYTGQGEYIREDVLDDQDDNESPWQMRLL